MRKGHAPHDTESTLQEIAPEKQPARPEETGDALAGAVGPESRPRKSVFIGRVTSKGSDRTVRSRDSPHPSVTISTWRSHSVPESAKTCLGTNVLLHCGRTSIPFFILTFQYEFINDDSCRVGQVRRRDEFFPCRSRSMARRKVSRPSQPVGNREIPPIGPPVPRQAAQTLRPEVPIPPASFVGPGSGEFFRQQQMVDLVKGVCYRERSLSAAEVRVGPSGLVRRRKHRK
jgi:hypothetical protein